MRLLAVIFRQPALRTFPRFIQGSEQIKIQYLRPVGAVKTLDKSILRRLSRLDKFQSHTMFFGPLLLCQWDQFWPVIHQHPQRIAAVCHYPVQHSHNALRRNIQVNFYRQRFTIKIIHRIEGPEASATAQCIMHKIDGPALV